MTSDEDMGVLDVPPAPDDDEELSARLERFLRERDTPNSVQDHIAALRERMLLEELAGRSPGLGLVDYGMIEVLWQEMEADPEGSLAMEIRALLTEVSNPTVKEAIALYAKFLPGRVELPDSLIDAVASSALDAFKYCQSKYKSAAVEGMHLSLEEGRTKLSKAQRKTARGKKRAAAGAKIPDILLRPAADLSECMVHLVGGFLINAGVFPPLMEGAFYVKSKQGKAPFPPSIAQERIQVERLIERWNIWRMEGSDGSYRHVGPWPFRNGELEAALCVPTIPKEFARQVFDAAIMEIVPQANVRWVDWGDTGHRPRMLVLAYYALWAYLGDQKLMKRCRVLLTLEHGGKGTDRPLRMLERRQITMTVLGRTLIAFDPYFGRSQSLELHPYLADAASLLPGSREGEEERRAFSDTLRNIAPLLTLNGYIGVDDDLMNAKIGIKSPEAAMIRDGIGRPSSLAFRYLEESVLDLLPSKLSEDIIRKKKHKYSKRYAELAGARKRNVDGEGSAEDYDISASKQDKAVKDAFLESQDLQRLLSDLGPDDSQSVTEEQYDEALALATKHLEHSSMPGHNAVDVHSFLLDGEKHYYLPDVVAIVSTEREERGGKPLAESTVRTRWVKDRKIPPPRRHEGYAVYSSADLDQIRLMAMSLDELGKPLGITGKTATNRLAPLRRKYQREMGFQHRQRLLDGEIG